MALRFKCFLVLWVPPAAGLVAEVFEAAGCMLPAGAVEDAGVVNLRLLYVPVFDVGFELREASVGGGASMGMAVILFSL